MSEIEYTIEPEDIEWEMDWTDKNPDGTRVFPNQPEKEIVFDQEAATALLLINNVFMISDHWHEKDWPEKAKKSTALAVICSDVFAWGCADAEEINVSEIEELYRMWKNDPHNGTTLWCMKKRREMPQNPVADSMRKDGVDLDSFQKEHNLRVNFYSGISSEIAKYKYSTYVAWAEAAGIEVLPFDKGWWAGWEAFKKSNPSWEKEVDGPAADRIREEFKKNNGWEGAD